ncbi:DUF2207 family protein [Gryllotalpicola ginsengisoli]|uniref:DUF2207 family protein n=1 Tax=Gryllotalpicola ginsengisoli TaxID=444608 RepID=UPI0009D6BB00|nr:DUF2207 domain-containing protein [Gryllotalpicola ginsengisoli]
MAKHGGKYRGSAPKRAFRVMWWAAVALWAAVMVVSSFFSDDSGSSGDSSSSVDDFSFKSLDADYTLGTDASGRSTLDTTETFVAEFPDYDQNKGIIRAIPDTYDGHSLHVDVDTVTDASGDATPYWIEHHDGFTDVYTGTDDYVHGEQTYVIHYTMRDVIHDPRFGSGQEFYWDVNGTGWGQVFREVKATLHVPQKLAGALTGQTACYQGAQGSTKTCKVTRTDDGYSVDVWMLSAHENVTIDVGFDGGTFQVPVSWPRLLVWVCLLLALLLLAAAIVVRIRRLGPPKGSGIIVPQYEPYPGIGVMEAAELLDETDRAFPALVTELVVSRAATMSVAKGKTKKDDPIYRLTLKDPTLLDDEDGAAVHTLFDSLKPDAHVALNPDEPKIGDRIRKLLRAARESVWEQELVADKSTPESRALMVVAVVVGVAAVGLGAWLAFGHFGAVLFYLALGVAVALCIAALLVLAPPARPTEKAVPAYEHLLGIREYLTVAEADRIRVLQSPEGAETRAAPSGEQLVHLYERLLPYAILFGIEDEWRKVLGEHYASTPTDLTPTVTTYFAGQSLTRSFATSSFATTARTSSWSGSGGGSSFSGFSGGGFSGGGGGGGGGGGR